MKLYLSAEPTEAVVASGNRGIRPSERPVPGHRRRHPRGHGAGVAAQPDHHSPEARGPGRELADYCNSGSLFTGDASLADMAHTGRLMETWLKPVNAAIWTAFRPGKRVHDMSERLPRDAGAEHGGFSWKVKK